MVATVSFFDMSTTNSLPSPPYSPVPITVGPTFKANDLRIVLQSVLNSNEGIPAQPPGFSIIFSGPPSPANQVVRADYWRMPAGATDTFVQWTVSPNPSWPTLTMLTARGADPGSAPTGSYVGQVTLPSSNSTPTATVNVSSISVPAAGTMILWFSSFGSGGTISLPTSLGCPAGWTNLVATPNSGATYYPYDSTGACLIIAKSFSSSGSTGTIVLPFGAENSAGVYYSWVFVKAALDVSVTAGTAPTTATTATAATFSTSTAVTPAVGSATTTSTATTAFNPLYGVWLSDPIALTGDPVTGSVTRWVQSTPAAGSSVTVQTSINNGATWDNATNNGAIPRLLVGDTTTAGVLVKIILTRVLATDAAPEVLPLEVQISANASADEVVPVGHGMIDKTTVNAVGGTQGTGSVTNVASSSAVIGRGGGQTGGGTSIKVHVTDLSGSIKRNVWAMPYTVPAGLNYGAAAQAMVVNRLPDQTAFAISTTTRVTPLLVYGMQQGGDPWQDIQDLATAIGYEAFFDAKGVFVFRPVPDPSVGDAVWEFDEDNIPLVAEATRELSNEQTFNHVIVAGQATSSSNPVTAEAFDSNPSSPTYILGPYGEVTERLTLSTITTQDQAQAAANALLLNSLGGADTVTIECVPQPALEPGDIVKINCGDVNVDGNYMINSMTTSLSPADPQQLVCFRQSTS
jgi:hypothetical protein